MNLICFVIRILGVLLIDCMEDGMRSDCVDGCCCLWMFDCFEVEMKIVAEGFGLSYCAGEKVIECYDVKIYSFIVAFMYLFMFRQV